MRRMQRSPSPAHLRRARPTSLTRTALPQEGEPAALQPCNPATLLLSLPPLHASPCFSLLILASLFHLLSHLSPQDKQASHKTGREGHYEPPPMALPVQEVVSGKRAAFPHLPSPSIAFHRLPPPSLTSPSLNLAFHRLPSPSIIFSSLAFSRLLSPSLAFSRLLSPSQSGKRAAKKNANFFWGNRCKRCHQETEFEVRNCLQP